MCGGKAAEVAGAPRATMPEPETKAPKATNAKLLPHVPLPFKEVMAEVHKVKPPEKKTGPKKH